MGATEALITYTTTNKGTIRKAFSERVADECNRHGEGNGYCGCICQKCSIEYWHDVPFATESEADLWVMNRSSKMDDSAAAAAYYVAKPRTHADSKRITKANDKVATALRAHNDLQAKFNAEFKNAKSDFVGCKNKACGSRVRRSLVRDQTCPVCNTSLVSPTYARRLESASAKVMKLREAACAARTPKPSKKIAYVVGGMVSE